jgi:hypothetical protein
MSSGSENWSEAEYLQDIDGSWDPDTTVDESGQELNHINKDDLGKYVIVTTSPLNGAKMLLYDRTRDKERWWTYYLKYAVKFRSKELAEKTASRLKYNDPKVVQLS